MTQNNADASAVSEGEMTANALLEALGTTLEPDLLVEALTHRSFSHENPGAKNYERLEFLGDAVLELVSTETLYKAHPDMNEGQLAKMRAKAVSEESLSKIAREKLNAGPYILLGHGESDQGGADKSSILCDIVESLIGATFIQHGIDEARRVVHHLVDETLAEVATEGPALDWKTSLTVKAHGMGFGEPDVGFRSGICASVHCERHAGRKRRNHQHRHRHQQTQGATRRSRRRLEGTGQSQA